MDIGISTGIAFPLRTTHRGSQFGKWALQGVYAGILFVLAMLVAALPIMASRLPDSRR